MAKATSRDVESTRMSRRVEPVTPSRHRRNMPRAARASRSTMGELFLCETENATFQSSRSTWHACTTSAWVWIQAGTSSLCFENHPDFSAGKNMSKPGGTGRQQPPRPYSEASDTKSTAGKSVTKIRNRMFEECYSYVTAVWKPCYRFVTKVLANGQDIVTKLSRSNVSILLIPLIFFESCFRTDVRLAVVTILLRVSGL